MREKGDKGRRGHGEAYPERAEKRAWGTLIQGWSRGWWKKTTSPQKGKRRNPSQVGEHSKREGIKRFKKNEEEDYITGFYSCNFRSD